MLELKNVSFKVTEDQEHIEIVKDVSLTIEDNRFTVITGPNGGGKSTLAKLIAGIERPVSGKIFYDGKDITDRNVTERARMGIGYAFQQPVRFKGITVKDLITTAAGQDLTTEEACRYLSEVGLCAKNYVDREANASLSGGELKRIEIATVMARKTKLSLFDEPEAGIDLWSFQKLIGVFEKIRDAGTSSVIIISHQERILDIADEIILIAGGQVVKTGSKSEILPLLLEQSDTCSFYTQFK